MAYAQGHPIRLIAGRLALDFVNTADWSSAGDVVSEKLERWEDVDAWLAALRLPAISGGASLPDLHRFRADLRALFLGAGTPQTLGAVREVEFGPQALFAAGGGQKALHALLAASALAILADPREMARLKICPGRDCGWFFIDETKNMRRTWCTMATCGNRAKAARHYARTKAGPP
ncbi:MAG: CGNR zinc finger domain-containing protein [Pseudomonadota bacterium]